MFRSIARLGRFLVFGIAMLISAVVFAVVGVWVIFGHGPVPGLPAGEGNVYSIASTLSEHAAERMERIQEIIQRKPRLAIASIAFVVVVLPLYLIAMALHRIARRLNRLAQTQVSASPRQTLSDPDPTHRRAVIPPVPHPSSIALATVGPAEQEPLDGRLINL